MARNGRRAAARVLRATSGGPQGPHLTRYSMYGHLTDVLDREAPRGGRLLAIGSSRKFAAAVGLKPDEIVEANYPAETILDLRHRDESFDFVVSDQVLEHVQGDPAKAMAETVRVVRPDGLVVHTTCFMNPIHRAPSDLWRFTPEGLELLLPDGMQVIDAGGWGNHAAQTLMRFGLRPPIPQATWHPLHRIAVANDSLRPIVTWIVARKPA